VVGLPYLDVEKKVSHILWQQLFGCLEFDAANTSLGFFCNEMLSFNISLATLSNSTSASKSRGWAESSPTAFSDVDVVSTLQHRH
jgi:hypothetical protein